MTNSTKFLKFFLPSTFFVLLMLGIVPPIASAQALPICDPILGIFAGNRRDHDKSVVETTINVGTTALTVLGYKVAMGATSKQTIGCASYAMRQSPGTFDGSVLSRVSSCQLADADTVCPSLFNQYGTGGQEVSSLNSQIAESNVGGSLLGMAYSVQNILENEPVPVNMAYFFNDYGRRLPVVGDRVFAQSVDYRQPFLDEIYDLWVVIRNLSYGLMSVVIMFVGIMMIMRKKISNQVIVNIQYALPKIALTLIFITFSYPIGAAIASVSWALFNSAQQIILSLADLSNLGTGVDFLNSQFGVGMIFAGFFISFLLIGVGLAGGMGAIIVIIISAILYLAVMVKAFFIYLKMLVQIVSAPLQFVFGAIPGNDDQTVNWFKRMFTYGVSIFLMQLTVQFMMLIVGHLLFSAAFAGDGLSDVFGSLYVIFGVPLLFLFGLGFAFKVPSMVENAVMGPKRK